MHEARGGSFAAVEQSPFDGLSLLSVAVDCGISLRPSVSKQTQCPFLMLRGVPARCQAGISPRDDCKFTNCGFWMSIQDGVLMLTKVIRSCLLAVTCNPARWTIYLD